MKYPYFALNIELSNAAFTDYPDELPQLLRNVASQIEAGCISNTIRDTNGNKVGRYYTVLEDSNDE